MSANERYKIYCTSLTCKLCIIGQSDEGESIIFSLYGDGALIYSCVTDSFVKKDEIVAKEILKKLSIDRVDALFWTHPHDDHSNGILELIDTFKPRYVYVPAELHSIPDGTVSKRILDKINEYRSCDKRFRYQPIVWPVSTNQNLHNQIISVNTTLVPFTIDAIAPSGIRARRCSVSNNYKTLNDFSLVISINIGDLSILLTGDVQDSMLQFVKDEIHLDVPRPNILKIPHHGSSDSLSITEVFDNQINNDQSNINASITTAKKSSRLPTDKAIEYYNSLSDHLYKIDSVAEEIALWTADIDIVQGIIKVITCENYKDTHI